MATPGWHAAPDALASARVLLVGVGGLGCAAATHLAAAGVGRLLLCDFDVVAAGNLGRQFLFEPGDVGKAKVEIVAEKLGRQNPEIRIDVVNARADEAVLGRFVPRVDLVLDATDNFGARLAINAACLAHRKPWVMGAAVRTEGQLMVLRPDETDAPCYRCAYGDAPEALDDCAGAGIVGPVAGLVGAAMAFAALQVLAGHTPPRQLQLFDGATWEWRRLGVARRPDCPACGG